MSNPGNLISDTEVNKAIENQVITDILSDLSLQGQNQLVDDVRSAFHNFMSSASYEKFDTFLDYLVTELPSKGYDVPSAALDQPTYRLPSDEEAIDKAISEDDFWSSIESFAPDSSLHIGAEWRGVNQIIESESDNVYIPAAGYCIFSCVERYFQLVRNTTYKFDRTRLSPYHNSKQKYERIIKEEICPKHVSETDEEYKIRSNEYYINNCPPWFRVTRSIDTKSLLFKKVNNNHKNSTEPYRIALISVGVGQYHAVLTKKPYKMLKPSDFVFKLGRNLDLVCDWVPIKSRNLSTIENKLSVIYDIETYSKPVQYKLANGYEINESRMFPFALGYKVIESDFTVEQVNAAETRIVMIPYTDDAPAPVFEVFFKDLFEQYPHLCSMSKIQFWAHNGNRFDTIFVKECENVAYKDQIKVGSSYKSLSLYSRHAPKTLLIFKDTLPFSLMRLKDIAKTLKCADKLDFDIAGWTMQKYIDNIPTESNPNPEYDWIKYLKQDVDTLAEVFIKLERMYNHVGSSLTYNLGLPGVAYELMMKTIYNFTNNCFTPKSPSMVALIKNAMFGGRVIAFKRFFSRETHGDVMISLDANSLYPSAMAIGAYPVGKPQLVTDVEKTHFMNRFKTFHDRSNTENALSSMVVWAGKKLIASHYIITIKFRIPNLPVSLVPVKREKTSTSPAMMYFPSNGVHVGTYNEVDIREMLLDGYEILEIINGIYWKQSERLFSSLVTTLFNTRLEEKKKGSALEYVYKIILNSMYGKLLESIDSTSKFRKSNNIPVNAKINTLPNGQIEVKTKLEHPIIKKPIHLGTYVTAYSRAIMNQYIRMIGIENIWYTDTDSLYTTMSAFKASGIKESGVLGGVKNDYGDNVIITEAIFLDQKRYFLLKEKANGVREYSAKYVGLAFKQVVNHIIAEKNTSDPGMAADNTEYVISKTREIYNEIADNFDKFVIDYADDPKASTNTVSILLEKWRRTGLTVGIIPQTLSFSVRPDKKGYLIDHPVNKKEMRSLGFNPNQEHAKISSGDVWPTLEMLFKDSVYVPGKIESTMTTLGRSTKISSKTPVTVKVNDPAMTIVAVNKSTCDSPYIGEVLTSNYYVYCRDRTKPPRMIYQEDATETLSKSDAKAFVDRIASDDKIMCLSPNPDSYTKIYVMKIIDDTGKEVVDMENKYEVTKYKDTGEYKCVRIFHRYFNTGILGPTTMIEITRTDKMFMFPIIYHPEVNALMMNAEAGEIKPYAGHVEHDIKKNHKTTQIKLPNNK